VTIAIGTRFTGGVIVCADSKVVASDGATTDQSKVSLSLTATKRIFGIADAAEDGNAAKMLAGEIMNAVCDSQSPYKLAPDVTSVMASWYNSYGVTQPPQLQFILGAVVIGHEGGNVYLCEPPATVLNTIGPVAIGRGARAVEPLLSVLTGVGGSPFALKPTLLRLAYLMYRAKKDEGSACGGNTHAIVISVKGGFAFIEHEEMKKAEEIAADIDTLLRDAYQKIMGAEKPEIQRKFVDELSKNYLLLAERGRGLEFPSLGLLKQPLWRTHNYVGPK
jgi:20S proteasome alpha/beta subunit